MTDQFLVGGVAGQPRKSQNLVTGADGVGQHLRADRILIILDVFKQQSRSLERQIGPRQRADFLVPIDLRLDAAQ